MISVKDASFGYDGIACITGLNFLVSQGDYLFIIGENGSGKSTLLNGLLSIKPPMSGSVTRDLKKLGIGYLPQAIAIRKDFPASVFEVVMSGCLGLGKFKPFYSRDDKRSAEKNLERLGIIDLKNQCFHELSGGQQRRVLLARALCASDGMLILDEPTAGLDVSAADTLYTLLSDMHKCGVTLVCVSHDLAAAKKYATQLLILGNGGQLYFGKAKDFHV